MTFPFSPAVEQQEVAERRAVEQIVVPREIEWKPGQHHYPHVLDCHGHCFTCGKCVDHPACAVMLDIAANPDNRRGVILWFRNNTSWLMQVMVGLGIGAYVVQRLLR